MLDRLGVPIALGGWTVKGLVDTADMEEDVGGVEFAGKQVRVVLKTARAIVCNTTNTSPVVSRASGSFLSEGVSVGDPVSGTGISAGTTVKSVDGPTTLTLSAPAIATGSGVSLTFGLAGVAPGATLAIEGTNHQVVVVRQLEDGALTAAFCAVP